MNPNPELARRREQALAMGGPEKLSRRRAQGLLDARARIDALIDPGSFSESGLLARSSVEPADRDRTPADGKVSGYARIDGRPVALVSNDFTVKGASSSLTNMRKIAHVKRTATQRGLPLVLLGESSGARMPDNMGSDGMGALLGNDPHQYVRHRETPWVSALLGDCFGSSAFYACISDHVVMRKGACMAIGSPRLVELAMGEKVDRETLGGHQHHASVTGAVDVVVDDDLAALAEIRRFLSYLPSSASEPPPRAEVPEGADEAASTVGDMLPASRTRGYDMRRLARRLLDPGSAYELKPEFGKTATTMLGRLDGHTVGVIGNNPMFKAGALDPAACAKITRFLAMCDSFNIPIVNLVDTPGFVIGTAAERQNAPTRIMTYMTALQMTTVPKLTVIVRKSYGQAYLNMGGGRNSDEVAAWPSAEVSFMDPRFGARIVSPAGASEETLAEVEEQLGRDSEVWGIAGMFAVQYVLEPGETRQWLVDMLRVHGASTPRAMSRRQLAAWPFNF